MYRFNCMLSDEIASRLKGYCERAGVAKVTVVSLALDQYLSQQELRCKLMDEMSDPVKMAEICKALGLSVPSEGA